MNTPPATHRRPGEDLLAALGPAAPAPDPADASPHRFPDGGSWRTEVPSVEGPEALEAVLAESARLDVPIHRVSQGSGVWMLTDGEIRDMVDACAARDIELCLFTGPRGTWDIGAGTRTPSGGAGMRARGHDAVAGCVEDAVRAAGLGVKCLLVADEGVLWTLHRAREAGLLPFDVTLKVSALIGPVNPASYAVLERLGADSLNVPSDLTLEHLTEIRRASRAPMDLYVEAPDDLGGYVRMYDVAEMIRRGAPLYVKFGLSRAPSLYPSGAHLRDTVVSAARERVRRGRLVLDLLERLGAAAGMSPSGSRLPGVLKRFPASEPLSGPPSEPPAERAGAPRVVGVVDTGGIG